MDGFRTGMFWGSSLILPVRNGAVVDRIIREFYTDLKVEDIPACLRYAIALVAAEDVHLSPAA